MARYDAAVVALHEIVPGDPDAIPDVAWLEKTNRQVLDETNRLETELKVYKNNLIKESIRVSSFLLRPELLLLITSTKMGYDDIGQHYHRIGDLVNSTKAYHKMRDFCTMPSHVVSMYLRMINVSIDQGAWLAVQSSVQRIRTPNPKESNPDKIPAKLSAAMGLALLCSGNYKEAAESFLDTDPGMVSAKLDDPTDEESYNEVITPNDIAVYGGLCALASMDREQLQKRVLENSSFRNYLELEPHIRRATSFFVSTRYSACLSILEAYKPDYLLDLHLQKHVGEIYFQIRSKAIQQYFIPFSCVTLSALSVAFNTDEQTIEHEVTSMIKRGNLDARIDLVDRVLLAKTVDPRSQVHEEALSMAKDYERTAHLRLLRMEIINAGLEVKAPKGQGTMMNMGSQDNFGNGSMDTLMGNMGRVRGLRSGGRR